MPSPPIQVFLTSIASQPALRQRQEYILRILQIKKIPFTSYDLASDEDAKKLWRRKAPAGNTQLPGLLVGGVCPGGYDEFSEAVEYGELETFLRLQETWEVDPDDAPTLAAKPVGVPGAASPHQITPHHKPSPVSPAPSPLKNKSKKKDGSGEEVLVKELDAGDVLGDTGLQGVNITDSELEALVAELGLEGDAAGDLVKGLSTGKDAEPNTPSTAAGSADTNVVAVVVEAPTSAPEITETPAPAPKSADTKNDDTKTDTADTDTAGAAGEQRV